MTRSPQALEGKHAYLTGGSGGIGLAIARKLVQNRCGVTLIARRTSALEHAAATLRESRPACAVRALALDVADEHGVAAAMPEALAQQPADLLINCAGIATPAEFIDADPADLRGHMDVNYFGAVWMTRAVLPTFVERGSGHIVNMASTASLIGVYGYSAYCPSKFALYGLSEVLRAELQPRGIDVTVVLPGSTRTAMLEHELALASPETKKLLTSTRVLSPEQVAEATLRAIVRRRFEVIPGLESRLSARSYRAMPTVGRAFVDLEIRRARR